MKSVIRIYLHYFPLATTDGSAFVASGLVRSVLESGDGVELIWWRGTEKGNRELPNLVCHRLPMADSHQETKAERLYRVFSSFFSGYSSQEELFFPQAGIKHWQSLGPADLAIYNYGFSWNWLSKGRHCGPKETKRVLYHHNLESDLILQRATGITAPIHFLNFLKLLAHEKECKDLVDENWFISDTDLERWVVRGGLRERAKCHFPDVFEEDYVVIKAKRLSFARNPQAPTLGFLGRLDFRPNAQGLSWILDKLCPLLVSRNFKGKIRIVGKNASKHHIKKMSQFSFVQYEGFQSSLDSFWTELDWLLAPHLEGSGVRVKLIESLMYQIPTLTHLKAAERLSPTLKIGRAHV